MAETYATYGELIGDASDIYLVDSGYVRHYTFRYGGGDCPSGCDINYYWKFSVYSDCIVQFDTSYYSDYTRIGVQNINAGKLNVYPNPASEKVTVEFADNKHNGTLLKLYGISGSLIQQINISSPKVELDISGIAPGIYDIELASSDLTIHRKLVVY